MGEPALRLEPRTRPRLPDLREPGRGSRLAARAVHWTVVALALLVVGGAVASFTVRVRLTVRAPGALEPVQVWPVRALEPGLVSAVLVRTGQVVRAGQPLLQLDTLELAEAVAQARAQHETAGL